MTSFFIIPLKYYTLDTEPFQFFTLLFITIKLFPAEAWIGLSVLLFLLICSALTSGSEISLFSITPHQKTQLEKQKSRKTSIILSLISKPEKLLSTIIITNHLINIGIVMISIYLITIFFDFTDLPFWFIVFFEIIVIVFIILLFAEIIPKIYAGKTKLKVAFFAAYPLKVAVKMFSPLSNAMIHTGLFFNKRVKKKQIITVNELSEALELTEGDIKQDKGILRRIVTFGSIDVKEILKPRVDVIAAEIGFSFKKVKSLILESGFSRLPVYEENYDNIKGILLIKDLLKYIESEDYEWQKEINPPFFVPETMKINDLLEEFREKKIHIAIVTDEYGGFLGIVTLEDIIEEIVGEINDENDEKSFQFNKIDEKNYIWDAKYQINDFYKTLSINDDIFSNLRGDSDTLAGLILEVKGEIPQKGETVNILNFTFSIIEADNRKIIKLKSTDNEEK